MVKPKLHSTRRKVPSHLGALLGMVLLVGGANAQDRISVADLSRFAAFGDPGTLDWNALEDETRVAVSSKDGAHAAVVVRGGDTAAQANVSSLLLFETDTLTREAAPAVLARLAATSTFQPIAFLRWLSDNETLVFAGTSGSDPTQVYRVNIRTRELVPLTRAERQLAWYDITPSGSRLLTLTLVPPLRPADNPDCRQFGCRVQSSSLYEAQLGGAGRVTSGRLQDLSTGAVRDLPNPEELDKQIDFCDPQYAGGISPDGRFALRFCRLRADRLKGVPEWGEYSMDPYYGQAYKSANARAWRVGFVVELETANTQRWSDAPAPNSAQTAPPIWIDGGEGVILPGVFESLVGVTGSERETRKRQYAVQVLDPRTRQLILIGRLAPKITSVASASWHQETQTLKIVGRDARQGELPPVYFRRTDGRWSNAPGSQEVPEAQQSRVRLTVEQTLNDRPRLYALDRTTGERRLLLDPNSWLAERRLGRVEAIQWIAKDGRAWNGGLYFPPDHQQGVRLPLVIQTHGFHANTFSLHGSARNFSGQALAAQDVLVLQVDEQAADYDIAGARAGYEGAIDHLDRLGLVDRNRVGTVGWSATGPTTASMLTHSEYPIAAAAFTDTGVYGWWFDLSQGQLPDLSSALNDSPTSSLLRVRTPLLMWSAGGVTGVWDWYAGLRNQNKPVEFWFLPTGTHDVFQVSQRLRTNQLLVDWFSFWLRNEERSAVVPWGGETMEGLRTQNARWRAMRERQRQVVREPRPPLLRWRSAPVGQRPPP